MKNITFIILLGLLCSFAYAYPVTVESQFIYANGTARNGTYIANFTFYNSTGNIVFFDSSLVNIGVTGKFKKQFDFPYFGNSSLNVIVTVDNETTGMVNVSYVHNSINSQHLQGNAADYYAKAASGNCPLGKALQNITLAYDALTLQCISLPDIFDVLIGDNVYLYNDTIYMHFNDTKMNLSIVNKINNIVDSSYIEDMGFNMTFELKSYFDSLYQPLGNYATFGYVDAVVNGNMSLKLNVTDQRFNDSAVNSTENIKLLGFNMTDELFILFLNLTDQRYNDTSLILSINESLILNETIQSWINANGNYSADRLQLAFLNQTNIFTKNITFGRINVTQNAIFNQSICLDNCSRTITFNGSDTVFKFLV